jgi:zinc protease
MHSSAAVTAIALLLAAFPASGTTTVRESTLTNGAPLIALLNAASVRQTVDVIFETGCRVLPVGQAGAVTLFDQLLQEGPRGQSAAEFRRELFLLNATLSTISDGRRFQLTLQAPPATLKAALQKVGRLLRQPKLTQADVKAALQSAIAVRRVEQQSLRYMVRLAALRHLYRDHPDAAPCTSTLADLEKLRLPSVQRAWLSLTQASRRNFATAGPMPAGQVAGLLEMSILKGSKARYRAAEKIAPAEFRTPPLDKGTEVILLEQAGSEDNQVCFIWPHELQIDTLDYAAGEVAMTLLGNAASGRLSLELREQRGLTYDARAYFASNLPHYAATTFAGAEQIAELIRELPRVYATFVEQQLSDRQLEVAKRSLVTSFRSATELPTDGFRRTLEARLFGRDATAWQGRVERWNAVSLDAVQRFIRTRMNSKPVYLVVAGDRNVLLPALEQAGYETESIQIFEPDQI